MQLGHESLFWTAMTLRRKNVFKQQHTEHKSIRFRMNPVVVQSQLGPLILERTKYYCLNVPREMSLVKYAMNGDCKVGENTTSACQNPLKYAAEPVLPMTIVGQIHG